MEPAASSSPKPAPQVNLVSSRNPKIFMVAGLGVLILVLIAIVGIISGAKKQAALPSDASHIDPLAGSAAGNLPGSGLGNPVVPSSGSSITIPSTPGTPGTPGMTSDAVAGAVPGSTSTLAGIPDRGLINPLAPATAATPGTASSTSGATVGTTGNITPGSDAAGTLGASSTPGSAAGRTPTGTALAAAGTKTYTVQESDTLWKIAQKEYGNGARYTLILKANPGLTPAKLRTGMKINIPAASEATAAGGTATSNTHGTTAVTSGAASSAATTSTKTIKVKEGDTLYAIARREYGNGELWDLIYKANKSKIANPHNLPAGLTLTIPARNG